MNFLESKTCIHLVFRTGTENNTEGETSQQQDAKDDELDVDLAQLNQRLRCSNTEKQVEIILGTPEDALGDGSIPSLIPRRTKKPDSEPSINQSSVIQKPFYNPGNSGRKHQSLIPDIPSLPPARKKALYRGRYFPCFGLLCAPLAGTEIFPYSPKMEKLHFVVMMDMPLDHFDGEPHSKYLDDIKAHMRLVFDSYQTSTKDRFLYRHKNNELDEQWEMKFPFCSHRFYEANAVRSEIGEDEIFTTNLESNPRLFEGYRENIVPISELRENHGRGSRFAHQQNQVVRSRQAEQQESRQLGVTANQMKVLSSDSLENTDVFGRKFDTFLMVAKRFLDKGHKSISSHGEIPMINLQMFNSYEQFEDWIFQPKDRISVPNATHEKCLYMEPWNTQFTETQKLKVAGWIHTLIKFDRIKLIANKVN